MEGDSFLNFVFVFVRILVIGTVLILLMSFWIRATCFCSWLIWDLICCMDWYCDWPTPEPVVDLVCFYFCKDWSITVILSILFPCLSTCFDMFDKYEVIRLFLLLLDSSCTRSIPLFWSCTFSPCGSAKDTSPIEIWLSITSIEVGPPPSLSSLSVAIETSSFSSGI